MATEYKLSYTGPEIDAKLSKIDSLALKSEIPTKTSELTNDSEYATRPMIVAHNQGPIAHADIREQITQLSNQVGGIDGATDGKVSTHNTNDSAHNDIRLLITELTTRLNALANSTDEDLDQMAEVVAYIKSNKSLIDGITTSKINVSDIINNLTTNVANKPLSAAQGVALKALIDAYVAGNNDIDTNRIIIGGCSNGGYMTMNMIMTYPEYFAAAYPICEAYADEWITDDMLSKIVNMPIWFTHSKSDQTVNVDNYTTATYNRLIAAGAKNVYFSLFENVSDTSGNYPGHVYDGHYSWIYTLNNECKLDLEGKEVTIWEWIAGQSK